MTKHAPGCAIDWTAIELVVFDIDGTLYDQRALRIRMAREMLPDALLGRSIRVFRVIRAYRRIRERLGEQEVEDFEPKLIAATASTAGCTQADVLAIVEEWIERRALPHLAELRYEGLPELLSALSQKGKAIGVFSDYPAARKLAALNVRADYVVCAGDSACGLLKPHPRGLENLIAAAGVTPAATILIGDRTDRDGLAAKRAGTRCLIRSSGSVEGWQTFADYRDRVFAPLLAR